MVVVVVVYEARNNIVRMDRRSEKGELIDRVGSVVGGRWSAGRRSKTSKTPIASTTGRAAACQFVELARRGPEKGLVQGG